MALRTLMLKKQLDTKRKAFAELEKKDADFEARSKELEESIAEIETEEQRDAVNEEIEKFEKEKAEHEQAKTDLDEEIRGLEAELAELEKAQAEPVPADTESTPAEGRKEIKPMENRKFFGMNAQERDMFFAREDVQSFLTETRNAIREKRAVNNVGLTIPEVMLGLIKENIEGYSKLYKYVNVRKISGDGRMIVQGSIPEAVWTDCCANLNELDLTFNDVEVGCWKVGGFFAVCNATIEDSDIALASELLSAIGQSIGLALDKAILYGTGTRMPLGAVTRLAQTSQPADYPATARAWVDLHAKNLVKINGASMTGAELIGAIALAAANGKNKYSAGGRVWVMNESTRMNLLAKTITTNAGGAIVAGIQNAMPVLGGPIEVLEFVPDNVIICGFFDLYLLAERAGQKFATSEHYRFLADQTVMKGTARYDGTPVIAEAFVAIGIANSLPTAEMAFAPDTANEADSE